MGVQRFSNQQIIEALQQTHGRIVTAAKLLGCSRDTITKRIDSSDAVRDALYDAKRGIIEVGEGNVYRRVESDDWEATKYLLDRQGKMNGWSPRQEVTGAEGKDLMPSSNLTGLDGMDEDERKSYLSAIAEATLRRYGHLSGLNSEHSAGKAGEESLS